MDMVEICSRFKSGRMIPEKEFDLEVVFPKMMETMRKYEIEYDPQNPVPDDDGLADRVSEAAVDFLSEVGVYCKDIQKVIRFDTGEILGSLKGDRAECLAGEGDDAKVWKPRRPDESDPPPWCHIGSGILATTEELLMKVVEGYAAIHRANSVAIPTLGKYKGNDITPSHPFEVLGSIQNIRLAREAMGKADRPGLPIFNVVPVSGTAQGTIAASYPAFGTRLSDGWLVAVYPEFKVTLESLSKVAFLKEIGANYAAECGALLGGYIGGPEGVAIASTAYSFFSTLVYDGTYHLNFPVTLQESIATSRKMLWAISVSSQAVSRNTSLPWYNSGYTAHGPATENYFYEAAAYILSSVVSGVTTGTPFPYKGVLPDGMTPLECLFHTEMADAAAKMTRNQANEIVNKLLEKYEDSLDHPDKGLSYPECFDVRENKPNDQYERLYDHIKNELFSLGIELR